MSKPHVSIEGLNVHYGDQHVLKDITVSIPERQITVMIGPSGCGKTTLLKSLNRLAELAEGTRVTGRVMVNGIDVYDDKVDVTDIRKRMGLIAQVPNLLPMSIYDNIAYGPRIHGLKTSKVLDQVVEDCLNVSGLWVEVKDRLGDPASKLSIGQQQRLCLARALAVGPEILLCDEPTSALDPISARHIEEQLHILKNNYTIVFVTHILRQAKRLADYVVFLYLGELVEHGPAREFFADPHNPRTQAYLKGEIG